MNKMILAVAAAAAMVSMTACGGASQAPKDFGDSLSVYQGEAEGAQLLAGFSQLPDDQKALYNKDDIMRGFKAIATLDSSQMSYVTGLQIGMQAYQTLTQYEKAGIKVNRKAFYEAYAKAFLADSVNQPRMEELRNTMDALQQQAQAKIQEFYMAEQAKADQAKENAPEAKENAAKGAQYIKAAKAKDASLVETPSGLVYKVLNPGEGEAIGEGKAKVKYTGKLIDGTVFDSNNDGVEFAANQVIPGFGEGLKMMKKGAKYTLYIPGKIAYGLNGSPDGKIGPNATLIFDVEVLDVVPEEK